MFSNALRTTFLSWGGLPKTPSVKGLLVSRVCVSGCQHAARMLKARRRKRVTCLGGGEERETNAGKLEGTANLTDSPF